MRAPQILVLVWYSLSLGLHLAKHGQKNETKYNFFVALVTYAMLTGLLWWGGFFG